MYSWILPIGEDIFDLVDLPFGILGHCEEGSGRTIADGLEVVMNLARSFVEHKIRSAKSDVFGVAFLDVEIDTREIAFVNSLLGHGLVIC